MSNLAIIPARGGSKRIPGKNIKIFLGKPIIAYSIEAALNSGLFEEIMVSTDDNKISEIAEKFGAKVPFLRSEKNSNDFAGLSDVCAEVIQSYEKIGKRFEVVCCILPTAPFVNSESLIKAKKKLDESLFNCVFPVVEYGYPIQRSLKIEHNFIKMRWPENISQRSQDLEKTYHDAGQFYFIRTETLLAEKKLFTDKSGAIIQSSLEVQDIDTEADWLIAEMKYRIINQI